MATDSALFTIEARPAPVSFAAAQTAVIVVDMQNDFGSPEGMFGRAGIDLTDIRATIEPTRHVLASARRPAMKVVGRTVTRSVLALDSGRLGHLDQW